MKIRIEWAFAVVLATIVVLVLEVFILRAALKKEVETRQFYQTENYARHLILKGKYGEIAAMIGQARIDIGEAEAQMAALYNELGFRQRNIQIKFFPIVVPKPGVIFDKQKWTKPGPVKVKE